MKGTPRRGQPRNDFQVEDQHIYIDLQILIGDFLCCRPPWKFCADLSMNLRNLPLKSESIEYCSTTNSRCSSPSQSETLAVVPKHGIQHCIGRFNAKDSTLPQVVLLVAREWLCLFLDGTSARSCELLHMCVQNLLSSSKIEVVLIENVQLWLACFT